ncbi:MAG: dTDP-glucose 4,6-dehydratase [Pseudomonadota bacterium]|nr:dTDP-glucose 4,6-dehydratase [Pseudomonadota bacterium]
MSILVTGGAGFIGSNFVIDWCGQSNEQIINLDLLTYAGNLNNLEILNDNHNHVFVQGDIIDSSLIKSILKRYQPRAVINFAAESHVDRSIHDPSIFLQTNIMGVFNLLESSKCYWQNLPPSDKEAFRFVQVSTDEVYGSLASDSPAFTEQNRYEPNSPYSASKASSDHIVRAYQHTYGLPTLTTNCSNNYGPYQFPEKLIPLMIHNALNHQPLPIYGDGLQIRDWLFVKDHCRAICKVLENGIPGETYNIGGKNEKTNIKLVKEICNILDKLKPIDRHANFKKYEDLISFVEDRPGHDRRYAIDNTKIEQTLNWTPKETFESGLYQTVQWYLANHKWVDQILSGDYKAWIEKQYS